LGVAVLQICLNTDSRSLYDYPARINFKELDERLNIVKNKYPLGLYYLLREMTERSIEHRPTFAELEAKLPSNIKNFSPVRSKIYEEYDSHSYSEDHCQQHLH
jgi:hypothetical protein